MVYFPRVPTAGLVVFVHGGPGLHSEAERRTLGPLLDTAGVRVEFWNEPSSLRGAPAVSSGWFQRISASLRNSARAAEPLTLVAHSAGAHAALQLLRERRHADDAVVLIVPSLPLHGTLLRILRLATVLYAPHAPELADRLSALAASSSRVMDPPLREALELAVGAPELLRHYWGDDTAFARFAAVLQEPEWGFDIEAFFSVLSELAAHEQQVTATPLEHRSTLIYGAQDPIFDASETLPQVRRLLPAVTVDRFPGGHWPHLERPEEFVETLLRFESARC
ncbi:MAG TPA: alpha/beta hydrolase [Vicinamibacterales bacterium]|nr:alpha/beta hydrolase [Vicinamibacterales bacterium]